MKVDLRALTRTAKRPNTAGIGTQVWAKKKRKKRKNLLAAVTRSFSVDHRSPGTPAQGCQHLARLFGALFGGVLVSEQTIPLLAQWQAGNAD